MSVYRTKDGRWGVDYRLNGRRIRKIVGSSRAEAEEELLLVRKKRSNDSSIADALHDIADALRNLAGERLHDAPRPKNNPRSVSNVAHDWLEAYENSRVRPSTIDRHKCSLVAIIPFWGDFLIQTLTSQHCVEYFNHRKSQVEVATINREFQTLQLILNYAQAQGYIKNNIVLDARKLPYLKNALKEPPPRERVYSLDELERLFRVIQEYKPQIYPIVLTAVHTGMRKGEILNLKWSQVNLKENRIELGKETKSHVSRMIPLDQTMVSMFLKIRRLRHITSQYVFVNERGRKISVRKPWEFCLAKAKIEGATFHDLRRTAASLMLSQGVDSRVIMKIMGHRSVEMVKRYQHPNEEILKRAMMKLDQGLNSSQLNFLTDPKGKG